MQAICGIIVSPTTLSFFLVQTGLYGPHYLKDSGFEIYKATTKIYVEKTKGYDIIGGPSRGSLMMREILDHAKTRYYEMSENGHKKKKIHILHDGLLGWIN